MASKHSRITGRSPKSNPKQTEATLRSLLRLLAKAVAARLAREQADDSPQQQGPDVK